MRNPGAPKVRRRAQAQPLTPSQKSRLHPRGTSAKREYRPVITSPYTRNRWRRRPPDRHQTRGERMQRALPLQAIALLVCLLVACSESGTRSPTAPNLSPPLAAALAPAADTVQVQVTLEIQTGHTVHFTIEITGGDPGAEPVWTCASADTTVALAARTDSGCSATGAAVAPPASRPTVTRGTGDRHPSVGLRVTPSPLAAALAPAGDTSRQGRPSSHLEITGGDPNVEPAGRAPPPTPWSRRRALPPLDAPPREPPVAPPRLPRP